MNQNEQLKINTLELTDITDFNKTIDNLPIKNIKSVILSEDENDNNDSDNNDSDDEENNEEYKNKDDEKNDEKYNNESDDEEDENNIKKDIRDYTCISDDECIDDDDKTNNDKNNNENNDKTNNDKTNNETNDKIIIKTNNETQQSNGLLKLFSVDLQTEYLFKALNVIENKTPKNILFGYTKDLEKSRHEIKTIIDELNRLFALPKIANSPFAKLLIILAVPAILTILNNVLTGNHKPRERELELKRERENQQIDYSKRDYQQRDNQQRDVNNGINNEDIILDNVKKEVRKKKNTVPLATLRSNTKFFNIKK